MDININDKINLKDMTENEVSDFMRSCDEKGFRGKQIFNWIQKGIIDIDEITNLSKQLKENLKEKTYISRLEKISMQESKKDGTRKYLYKLEDGNCIESVFMKYKYGNTICVSSQAGCRMGCKFCASTIGGKKRDLTAGEILDQIIQTQIDVGEKIGHIVMMGTGEPFDNYENVFKFINIVNSKNGLNIGMRNITVSTCGIVPAILKFADDFPQVNLAISLHAPNNEIRSEMMPINKKYNIEAVIQACREYVKKTNRRITFEYTLVEGKNDNDENINQLISLLRNLLCHINLIPLNKVVESGMESTNRKRADEIAKKLTSNGIPATVRRELGSDIDGACGQLRLSSLSSN